MSDYFNCKLCDKKIKIKPKKKYLYSQNHKSLSMSRIFRYSVINPDFLHIGKILTIYVLDFNENFAFYFIICKWHIRFSDTIVSVKSNTCFDCFCWLLLKKILIIKN